MRSFYCLGDGAKKSRACSGGAVVRVCTGEPATARTVGLQRTEDMEQGHPGLSHLCPGLLLISPIGRTPQGTRRQGMGNIVLGHRGGTMGIE